jgi:hypothetical protein
VDVFIDLVTQTSLPCPSPERLDQAGPFDGAVPGDERKRQCHRRGDDEPIPRIAQEATVDAGEGVGDV